VGTLLVGDSGHGGRPPQWESYGRLWGGSRADAAPGCGTCKS
jgi:hypothetical protein